MNETLHKYNDPVIPAIEGWEQMEFLLDQHLPVRKRRFYSRFAWPVAASVMVMLLTGLSLQLDTALLPVSSYITSIDKEVKQQSTLNTIDNSNDHSQIVDPVNNKLLLIPGQSLFTVQSITGLAAAESLIDPIFATNAEASYALKLNDGIIEKQLALKSDPGIISSVDGLPVVTSKTKSFNQGNKFEIAAGVGMNVAFSGSQNLQPYPVAMFKYNISPTLFVATGLSAWSPAPGKTGGVSKTVYLNDSVNNIQLYNEVTDYQRVHYGDIPLTVGANISKRLSVEGGLQLSVLTNKKISKKLAPYDYRLNNVTLPVVPPVSPTAVPPQQEYNIGIRNIDYRFVTSVRYNVNKASIGISYQHGLKEIGKGSNSSNSRNNMVSLNLLYRIK